MPVTVGPAVTWNAEVGLLVPSVLVTVSVPVLSAAVPGSTVTSWTSLLWLPAVPESVSGVIVGAPTACTWVLLNDRAAPGKKSVPVTVTLWSAPALRVEGDAELTAGSGATTVKHCEQTAVPGLASFDGLVTTTS